jgi:hypothetical protein
MMQTGQNRAVPPKPLICHIFNGAGADSINGSHAAYYNKTSRLAHWRAS